MQYDENTVIGSLADAQGWASYLSRMHGSFKEWGVFFAALGDYIERQVIVIPVAEEPTAAHECNCLENVVTVKEAVALTGYSQPVISRMLKDKKLEARRTDGGKGPWLILRSSLPAKE